MVDRYADEHPHTGAFCAQCFAVVLDDLGLAEGATVSELRQLTEYLALRPGFRPALSELCSLAGDFPEGTEQLIRRVVETGLKNLAARGNRNAYDPVFTRYADTLFRPLQLKLEMRYLIDGIEPHGRPSAGYFLRRLADICGSDLRES